MNIFTLGRFSLVPRPFPPPVFDPLQFANTEREDLGDLVMCGCVRSTEGRHTGAVIIPVSNTRGGNGLGMRLGQIYMIIYIVVLRLQVPAYVM